MITFAPMTIAIVSHKGGVGKTTLAINLAAAAQAAGAVSLIIDTPPHADSAASKAVEAADMVLIPCRPSAFDLAAIRTTGQLVKLLGKPAALLFMAGPARAPTLALGPDGRGVQRCSAEVWRESGWLSC